MMNRTTVLFTWRIYPKFVLVGFMSGFWSCCD
jgi:hypothetical protein